jgi:NAD(P)-dependent dehydrogenase (short-subunit alcohol dehydrogenase family)
VPGSLMDGHVAIVTGAASGIGRATALRLCREGAKVTVVDIDPEWGQETVRLIDKEGGEAMFARADVTREGEVHAAVDATKGAYGKIDVLVNNAGIALVAKIVDTTEAQWDRILNTNLKSAFLMSKHVIPHLVSNGGGAIVNTASDAGIVGFANLSAYCASKGGIIQLTRALALEYGAHNVRVNAVAPTSTLHTRMLDHLFATVANPDAVHKSLANAHPLKRLGTAEEVAELITFLASPRAAYITGAVYPIDGGITAACPVPEF